MPDIGKLLWPRSVAVVGASSDTERLRGRILQVMKGHPFAGPIYPVCRSEAEVQGLKAFRSVADAAGPRRISRFSSFRRNSFRRSSSAAAPPAFRAATILSSGFAEEPGGAGRRLQDEIRAIAERYDMAVSGPNGEGFANTAAALCPTFSPVMEGGAAPLRRADGAARPGRGRSRKAAAWALRFFDRGRPKNLSFRYIVTTGNEACLETFDFVDYMLDEGKTDVFLLLLEDVKNFATFDRVAAKALRAGKPLIVGKLGQSERRQPRGASHTAARAGSARRLSRPVRAPRRDRERRDLDEMVDIAAAFLTVGPRLPAGKRVGICTSSGGGGAWVADACVAAGLDVPELDAETRALIDARLPSYGTSQNPVDVTAQAVHQFGYAEFARLVAGSPAVDGVIVVVTGRYPRLLMRDREPLEKLARESAKPILMWSYTQPAQACSALLREAGYPLFTDVHNCARALRVDGGLPGRPRAVGSMRRTEGSLMGPFKDIGVETSGFVALIEIRRPPNNFFDIALIREIADALEALDRDDGCRAVVLASQGKAFCAGANFGDGSALEPRGSAAGRAGAAGRAPLYGGGPPVPHRKPIIGAIHGAAVGGGLGLALVADFRVTCPEARFCANFTRLGFHPGFGLTTTLPEVIGKANAALMFYTSRRVTGEEAHRMGLADMLVAQDQVRPAALKLAAEIAENAPLGVIATRATMRAGLADRVRDGDRARAGGAEPPAHDRRLQGRRQGHGRASRPEFRRPLITLRARD